MKTVKQAIEAPTLLYLLNVSNPDRMSSDSGWLFADILAPALCDAGARITIAAPVPLTDPRVAHVFMTSPGSKYEARFGFNVTQMMALLRDVRPDVVVANQVEAAPGIRSAMLAARVDATLAGYCHYVPFHLAEDGEMQLDPSLSDAGLGSSVVLAFFAGLMACDRIMVHSVTAKQWISEVAQRLSLDLGERLRVVPPPADPRLVPDQLPVVGSGAVGVYNHRLYEHYGTGEFLHLAQLLGGFLPVKLQVMDLFGTRRAERARLDASPQRYLAALGELPHVQVVSDNGDRGRYRSLLAAAAFGVAPFRPAVTWSMSVIDCMAMGVPVIAPRLGWLAEAVDKELLFDTPDQAVALVARLLDDPGFAASCSARGIDATRLLAPAIVAQDYLAAVTG